MKTFLLKDKSPTIKWGNIPYGYFFEGKVPEGYDLAVVPYHPFIVLDVDVKGDKNGFNYIPNIILSELFETYWYETKSGGRHYWIKYSGDKTLMNRATKYGIDLRCEGRGYVKWNSPDDVREIIPLINESSKKLNTWIESLFS